VGLLEKKYSGNLDKETALYMGLIVNATARMQNLIKDLLEFSRIGRNESFTEVDCNHVLKIVLTNLTTSIEESHARITSSRLPVLTGNGTELISLFQNLISNAIKFRKKSDVPEVEISCEDKDDEFLFAVKDNGIGIEKKFEERIFIIFQRLHSVEDYPGTGIGLASCKKIVSMHGGRIWIESKVGKGTVFYFTMKKEIPL
jgi:light-regulated signal transduction histidine kinase (bacteriophytochrome)